MPATPFKGLILRAVLRDVYPMVIRLLTVPDSLDLTDFDDIFHAVLGWDSGIGYAFQIQGQEFSSFQRKTRSTELPDFRLHRDYWKILILKKGKTNKCDRCKSPPWRALRLRFAKCPAQCHSLWQ
jgi:hypothetical protein